MTTWNTTPQPTQAKAYLGVANQNAIFSFNPDEVKWSYKNNTISRDTIGGRVVQVLSASVEAMTVIGRAGSRERLQIFSRDLKNVMQYHIKTSEPVSFKVPSRNWDFRVYIQNVSSLGWDVTTTSYPYQITLIIEEDLNNIIGYQLKDNTFDNLIKGIGYNPEFHGGNTGEATRYVEAMQNALGAIDLGLGAATDGQNRAMVRVGSGGGGGVGRGKYKPRSTGSGGNAGLAKKLLNQVDLNNVPQVSSNQYLTVPEIYSLAYWALEQMGDLTGDDLKETAIIATAVSFCETQSHNTRAQAEAVNGIAYGLWQMNDGLGTSLWDPVVSALRMAESYYKTKWAYWACAPGHSGSYNYRKFINQVRSEVG